MCGICGFTGQIIDRDETIKNMTEVITHRGPDDNGFYLDGGISMGFRRLSIIDLGTGHQPIYNEDQTLVLTFNGEIYNYRELREELLAQGHVFSTETDSEVLLHGFEQWGEKLLDRLRGMFGFAIYNKKDKSLFIARDFFGIKPMHYTQVGDSLSTLPKSRAYYNSRALRKNLITVRSTITFPSSMWCRPKRFLRAYTAFCPAITCGIRMGRSRRRVILSRSSIRTRA